MKNGKFLTHFGLLLFFGTFLYQFFNISEISMKFCVFVYLFWFFKNNFFGVLANNTKSAYFRHIFVNNFFFKNFFLHFSTFLKSAWNSAFCDTFSDFFKPKVLAVLMEFGLKLCKKYKYDFKKKQRERGYVSFIPTSIKGQAHEILPNGRNHILLDRWPNYNLTL